MLLVQHAVEQGFHVFGADRVEGGEHLVEGEEGPEAHLLLRQAIHAAGGRLQRQHEVALEVVLGPPELLGADAVLLERADLLQHRLEHLAEIRRLGARVHVEDAGVPVPLRAGVHGVHQRQPLAHFLEQAGRHAPTDHVVEEVEGIALGSGIGDAGEAHHHVHLLQRLGHHVDARAQAGGRALPGRGGAPEALEARGEELVHLLVLHVTGHRHRDAPRRVLLLEVPENGGPVERLHPLPLAEDGAAEGMPGPDLLREEIVDEVVGGVLHHLDLLEDHRLLLLDIVRREERPHQDVAEEIHRQGQVLVEHAHVEAGVLLRGEGIHVPAYRVDGAGDRLRGAGRRPLEDEMLDEVGDPPALLGLHAGARVHPHPHRHRAHMRHRLGDEADAVGEDGLAVALRHYEAPEGTTLSCSFSASPG